jgi:hypothetical protein
MAKLTMEQVDDVLGQFLTRIKALESKVSTQSYQLVDLERKVGQLKAIAESQNRKL